MQSGGSQAEPKMNFFEAIFSYVFGDGDPNVGWEEERWQTVSLFPFLTPIFHFLACHTSSSLSHINSTASCIRWS